VIGAIDVLMTEARKDQTIWIETRWNEEEIIDTDASKKDNQRILISGKCNLSTLSREEWVLFPPWRVRMLASTQERASRAPPERNALRALKK
jgi:hypothetical protein